MGLKCKHILYHKCRKKTILYFLRLLYIIIIRIFISFGDSLPLSVNDNMKRVFILFGDSLPLSVTKGQSGYFALLLMIGEIWNYTKLQKNIFLI